MRELGKTRLFVFVSLALGLCLGGVGQDSEQDRAQFLASVVTTSKDAFFMAPSRLILDGGVKGILALISDRYAIIGGETPPKETGIATIEQFIKPATRSEKNVWVKSWDMQTDAVRDVPLALMQRLAGAGESGMVKTSQPGVILMTDDQGGLATAAAEGKATTRQITTNVYKMNLTDNSVRKVVTINSAHPGYIEASPLKPFFVWIEWSGNNPIDAQDLKTTIAMSIFDLDGKELRHGQSRVHGSVYFRDWTQDGVNMIGHVVRRGAPGTPAKGKTVVLNTQTCQISETEEEFAGYSGEQPTPALELDEVPTLVKLDKTSRMVRTLWLTSTEPSESPRCLVCGDVSSSHWISSKLDKLAYVADGRLFARDLVRMDLAAFEKAKAAAEREMAMSKCKQVALGMLMYSADSDDFMPLSSNWQEGVGPYIRNDSILDGFVYTYQGGALTGLQDPAGTEIGYIPISGGRCVAYADGHVVFRPGP